MIESLSLPVLLLIFGASAVLIWFAGIKLSEAADILVTHFGLGKQDPLTYRAASLVLVLEGIMVITVLTLVVVGNQLSPSVIYLGVSPIDAAIVLVWLAGIYMIGKARTDLPWHKLGVLPDSQKEKRGHSMKKNMIRP